MRWVSSSAAREQVVGQFRRHLRAADLGGVQAHRLADDRLALGHELPDLRLREAARIAELGVHLAQAIEFRQVGRRRDDDEQERVAHRGRAHVHDFDPAGSPCRALVVVDDSVPARDLAVGAHLETEERVGGGDLALREGHLGPGARHEHGEDEARRQNPTRLGCTHHHNPPGEETRGCIRRPIVRPASRHVKRNGRAGSWNPDSAGFGARARGIRLQPDSARLCRARHL